MAGRFHFFIVLQELVMLHPLEVQELFLHLRLFRQRGLTADAVQRVQQDRIDHKHTEQEQYPRKEEPEGPYIVR